MCHFAGPLNIIRSSSNLVCTYITLSGTRATCIPKVFVAGGNLNKPNACVLFFQFYFCVVVIEKLKEKYSHETLGTFDADHWDFVERFTARHFTRMNVVQSTLYDILKCYDEDKGTKQTPVRINIRVFQNATFAKKKINWGGRHLPPFLEPFEVYWHKKNQQISRGGSSVEC